MAKGILFVVTSPLDDEAAYNRWYDEQHLGEVLAVAGFTAARRYRRLRVPARPAQHDPPLDIEYAAVYEIEGDDLAAAYAALGLARETGAVDMAGAPLAEDRAVWLFEEIADAGRAGLSGGPARA